MRKEKRLLGVLLILLTMVVFCLASCSEEPEEIVLPGADARFYLYDDTGTVSRSTREYIEANGGALCALTGAQAVVAVMDDVPGDIDEFTYLLFNEWRIGSSAENDGILLVIEQSTGKSWALPGRGFENLFAPDTLKQLMKNYLEPSMDLDDTDTAVYRTYRALISEIEARYDVSVAEYMASGANGKFTAGGGVARRGGTSGTHKTLEDILVNIVVGLVTVIAAAAVVLAITLFVTSRISMRREMEMRRAVRPQNAPRQNVPRPNMPQNQNRQRMLQNRAPQQGMPRQGTQRQRPSQSRPMPNPQTSEPRNRQNRQNGPQNRNL